MLRFLTRPVVLAVMAGVVLLALAGLVGGPIGASLLGGEGGTGPLGGPMAHVQLQPEAILPHPGQPLGFLSPALTNSILAAWLTILLWVGLAGAATRRLDLVPRGLQNFVEAIVEMLLGLVESVAGRKNGRRFFPVVATIFLFIVTCNWLGLLPGFGSVGLVEPGHGEGLRQAKFLGLNLFYVPFGAEHVEGLVPFLRSANTDLNTPLALALVAMLCVEYWGISTLGLGRYVSKFLNVRRILRRDFLNGFIDLFTGILEGVTEVAKIISFTFRLFGNIFAGEVLLVAMVFLWPFVAVIPFFGLEMFVGFIQAFIFAMLTLVFAVIAVSWHEPEEPSA